MNFNEIRMSLPKNFDPVDIWFSFQDPNLATSESFYVYAEDGGLSIVWVLNSFQQFSELMSCLIFKESILDGGLEIYNSNDTDTLNLFKNKVTQYQNLKSTVWDFKKCNDFIKNDFDNDFGLYGFCIYEFGKVADLLSINQNQFEYLKQFNGTHFAGTQVNKSFDVTDGKLWICKNYHSNISPSESRDKFLKYLSSSVLINE